MTEYLEYIRHKYSNHLIIIIDVLTDCIKNFNDEKESLKFIDILNELINHFDITIIGVIHENPSKTDSKARGHIGTEITNKATTVFSVGYPSDKNNILEITFKKCRSSERYQPIYCKYEPNLKKLVEAENLEVQAMKQTKAQIEDVSLSLINILDTGAKERKEVISLLCPEFDCSERTITQRLSEIYQLNFLEKYGYVLVYDAAANNDRNKKLYSIKSLNQ
jgi:hypothetical protein